MAGEESLLRADADGDDSGSEGAMEERESVLLPAVGSAYIPANWWACVSTLLSAVGLYRLMSLKTSGDGFFTE